MAGERTSWLVRHKGKLLLLVGLVGCVGYFPVSLYLLKHRVRGFCAGVKPGELLDAVMARGVAAGLRDLESPRRETGTAALYDAVGFYRLFCNLEYEGDRITRTSISMMD